MFDAAECLFLYVESSLRVGGEEDGIDIDLPVQREAATGYPVVPASSLKGALRPRPVAASPDRAAGPARLAAGERGITAPAQPRGRLGRHPPPFPGPFLGRRLRLGDQPRDPGAVPTRRGRLRREGRARCRNCRPSTPRRRAWRPSARC